MPKPDRFVRLPTQVLEALLHERLSGAQWRILLWVIRNTYGWNRPSAPFTWYRMAREIRMSRPALYRAGQALLAKGVLVLREGQLALETKSVAPRQRLMPGVDVAGEQRFPLPESNVPVANEQRMRCRPATLFRRAKDSSKDRLKTYKDKAWNHRRRDRETAGAAAPIPGKYERLSKN